MHEETSETTGDPTGGESEGQPEGDESSGVDYDAGQESVDDAKQKAHQEDVDRLNKEHGLSE